VEFVSGASKSRGWRGAVWPESLLRNGDANAPQSSPRVAYQTRSRLQHESRVSMNTGRQPGVALYM
jgi:hypothetical protein